MSNNNIFTSSRFVASDVNRRPIKQVPVRLLGPRRQCHTMDRCIEIACTSFVGAGGQHVCPLPVSERDKSNIKIHSSGKQPISYNIRSTLLL